MTTKKEFSITPLITHKIVKEIFTNLGLEPGEMNKDGIKTTTSAWMNEYFKINLILEKGTHVMVEMQCWAPGIDFWIKKFDKIYLPGNSQFLWDKKTGLNKIKWGEMKKSRALKDVDDYKDFLTTHITEGYNNALEGIKDLSDYKKNILDPNNQYGGLKKYHELDEHNKGFIKSIKWTAEEMATLYETTEDEDFLTDVAKDIFLF